MYKTNNYAKYNNGWETPGVKQSQKGRLFLLFQVYT